MIKVVTDSVASLPKDIVEDENIEVVSLYLNENGHEHVDATMDLDDFYLRIYDMADNPPTSSQPSQSVLEELFESFAKAGHEVLGIWISTGLSGAYDGVLRAARSVEARNINFRYCMIDSSSCGFDEAFPVLEGARAVKEGKTLAQAAQAVLDAIKSTRFLFTPETLTFLKKGGRASGQPYQAFPGTYRGRWHSSAHGKGAYPQEGVGEDPGNLGARHRNVRWPEGLGGALHRRQNPCRRMGQGILRAVLEKGSARAPRKPGGWLACGPCCGHFVYMQQAPGRQDYRQRGQPCRIELATPDALRGDQYGYTMQPYHRLVLRFAP